MNHKRVLRMLDTAGLSLVQQFDSERNEFRRGNVGE